MPPNESPQRAGGDEVNAPNRHPGAHGSDSALQVRLPPPSSMVGRLELLACEQGS